MADELEWEVEVTATVSGRVFVHAEDEEAAKALAEVEVSMSDLEEILDTTADDAKEAI